MTVKINKPALNLREELASLRNQGGLPKEDKLYLDNLVDNGDFSNGTTGWGAGNNASLSISSGRLRVTNNVTDYGNAGQGFSTQVGKTYVISLDFYASGTGSARWRLGSSNRGNELHQSAVSTSDGTHVITFIATTTTTYITVYSNSTGDTAYVEYDNISVQEVGENLVTNGTFASDLTGWTAVNTGGQIVEQTGGKLRLSTTGAYIDANQLLTNVTSGKNYTISFDFTITSGQGLSLVINGIQTNYTSSGSITRTYTSDGSDFIQFKRNGAVDLLVDNVIVTEGNHQVIQSIPHGYDVKDVYIDGELAREGEAYDYQVKTDGINQWLKPTIEPTATTETAVIGVRK